MRMMVGFLRKVALLQVRFTLSDSPTLQSLPFLHFHHHPFSSSSKAHSFTVSHLINSCGFSHQEALSASKFIHFETPEKPDSVFSFFNSHGFSKSQTSKIVRSQPQLIVSDPEKSLLPKLQFFYSKGVSKPDVARIVVSTPAILKRSLENQIIPSYNFFKDFFQSEEMAMGIVKRFARILLFDLHTYVESNINALQEFEVPKSNIAALLRHQPRVFMVRPNQFREILEEVKKMGFDPSQMKFVLAVQAIRGMSKSTWERKIDAYKSWCCSEEEIRLAFLKLPWSMVLSEDKLMATMDFYVNKMGWESSFIARRPVLLSLSLEKRIIPRYSVVQVLLSKGLINKDISPRVLFESTEKKFMQKFVNLYKKEASQLLNLYQERKKSIFQKKQDCLPEGRGSFRICTP
ncbi:transcription termination factor MTERF5, chloroplastic-like [Vitis riparia]|uniref:transcription termination factor MTERF5, chloroplastic-like n=1 Tax=Vitis riparia TaxID=96939 RepID=UPI00155A4440|nr:transcription termination factor MTERF5, chloroplastic-like [Vitis riparia]XP_034685087.1 transcription termination factor MTERF5, chloroplastic-like [Vitis riparia]XP_034685088.1 transcription termination factor MTERF5, chloroplastic-like [Vitis riparia]